MKEVRSGKELERWAGKLATPPKRNSSFRFDAAGWFIAKKRRVGEGNAQSSGAGSDT
jgi:hypothetical protein